MKTTKTQAIVLRRTNYGETDRILQLLTPMGRAGVIARGVRKEKSKLAGGIELFAVCDVVFYEGKGDLGVLTSARLVKFYRNIMNNYDRMQFAYAVIKLVANASEMVDGLDWYNVLNEVLASLDTETVPFELIQTWFYLRYSDLLGHGLSLYYDVDGNKLSSSENYQYYDIEKGFRLAKNGDINSDHIKLLRLISTKTLNILNQIGGISEILPNCLLVARQHAAIK